MRTIAPLLLLVGAASAFTTNAARLATPRVAASVRMGLVEELVTALPTTEPIKAALAAVPLPDELVTGLAVAPYAVVAALVLRTAFERLLVPVLCSSGSAEQEGSLKSQQASGQWSVVSSQWSVVRGRARGRVRVGVEVELTPNART